MNQYSRKWTRHGGPPTKKGRPVKEVDQKPISIIIPAYKAEDYIETCLDSIYNQTFFKCYDNAEILICVDNCEPTLDKLLSIIDKYEKLKIRVFSTYENVGPYIIKNMLIGETVYENILFFDADDILMENALSIMFSNFIEDVVRFKYLNFNNNNLKNTVVGKSVGEGVFLIKKDVFDILGGFLPWKCGADSAFRVLYDKAFKTSYVGVPLFYRRIHDNSLTQNKKTGMLSKLREQYRDEIKKIRLGEFFYVEKETVKIKRIIDTK